MDITTLAARDTATITLLHPATGEPLLVNAEGAKATITLYGPGSKQHQAARAARERRLMASAIANQGKAGKPAAKADPEQERRDVAADLAACTESIGGWDYKGATDAKALEAAYADTTIGWVADQVQRALGDWGNFLPEQPAS